MNTVGQVKSADAIPHNILNMLPFYLDLHIRSILHCLNQDHILVLMPFFRHNCFNIYFFFIRKLSYSEILDYCMIMWLTLMLKKQKDLTDFTVKKVEIQIINNKNIHMFLVKTADRCVMVFILTWTAQVLMI